MLAKTNKPIGIRLQRFIVDQVLPQFVRKGHYAPSRQVVDGQLVERAALDPRLQLDLRLARKLEIEDRKFKVRTLQQTIAGMERQVSANAITSLRVVATELVAFYRAKDAVEKDFEIIKTDLELRPDFHHTESKLWNSNGIQFVAVNLG